MTREQIVKTFDRQPIERKLNSCELYVLEKSWEGEQYETIAKELGYDKNYIKQIGAKLWSELSSATGKTITKKNLRLILNYSEIKALKAQKITDSSQNSPQFTLSHPEISFPSAPLAAGSFLYTNRPPNEDIAYSEIESPGCLVRIKGARKIGKSSLLNQILANAETKNHAIATVDFLEVESAYLTDLEKFLQWFCASISYQLGFSPQLEEYWESEIGSKVNCRIYLENYLLKQIDRPIVVALNELNRVFEYPHLARDFLPMLRFWHEQSKGDPVWQNLRLILVHSTDIYVSLNFNQSPFNVGLSLQLPMFDFQQTAELARRYGLDLEREQDKKLLDNLYEMLNGHPFLTSLAFYYLQTKKITFKELIETASTSEGIFQNHLLELLVALSSDRHLVKAFRDAIAVKEGIFLDAIVAHKLESLGLVKFDRGLVKPICELYRLYFYRELGARD